MPLCSLSFWKLLARQPALPPSRRKTRRCRRNVQTNTIIWATKMWGTRSPIYRSSFGSTTTSLATRLGIFLLPNTSGAGWWWLIAHGVNSGEFCKTVVRNAFDAGRSNTANSTIRARSSLPAAERNEAAGWFLRRQASTTSTETPETTVTPDFCHDCRIALFQMRLNSPYGYDFHPSAVADYESLTSSCSKTAYATASPTPIPFNV
jgi:hypothetical protein